MFTPPEWGRVTAIPFFSDPGFMLPDRPKLAVVMPVYNADSFLRAAVESVLRQSFRDFELIAIDDGSTDDSLQVLQGIDDPRLRIERNHENLGVTATLNKGLRLAQSPVVARHDADDRSHPDRFATQFAYLVKHSKTVAVGAAMELVDPSGKFITRWAYPLSRELCRWHALFDSPLGHPVAMFRRDEVLAVGGYSAAHPHAEDYDLWARLMETGSLTNLPQALLEYRIHAGAVSSTSESLQVAARGAISKRMLNRYLSEDDADCLVDIAGSSTPCISTLRPAIDAYCKLEENFRSRHAISASVESEIRSLLTMRISEHAAQLTAFKRIEVYRLLSSRLRLSARDHVQAIKMLVPRKLKDTVKRLVGLTTQRRELRQNLGASG